MTSESLTWKLEQDMCRCCHSEGSFPSLSDPCNYLGQQEIYSDMLSDCFDVHISPVPGPLCTVTYTICQACVMQLRAACNFKKQVLYCEERFQEMYSKNFINVSDCNPAIKVEVEEIFKDDCSDEYVDSLACASDEHTAYTMTNDNDDRSKRKKVKPRSKRTKVQKTICKTKKKKQLSPPRDDASAPAQAAVTKKKGNLQVEDFITERLDNTKRFSCKACENAYRRVSDLRYHIARTHVNEKLIKCTLCPERFMYHRQKADHMNSAHLVKKPDLFQCAYCHRQFKRKNTLAEHMIDVHVDKKCVYCQLSFPRKKYVFHMNEAHGVPMPTCGVCGLRTILQSALVRHQRSVHLNEKNLQCTVCKKSFYNTSNLRDHMITHRQDRVFKCDVCAKSFARKSVLASHYRLHTGERPFRCAVCGAAFVQRGSLSFHMKSRHRVSPEIIKKAN